MPKNEIVLTNTYYDDIKSKIFTIRGIQVMIDRDLAELYGVETKVFNQAVKRNSARFPQDFMFQLNDVEKNELVTNCDRFKILNQTRPDQTRPDQTRPDQTANNYYYISFSLKAFLKKQFVRPELDSGFG